MTMLDFWSSIPLIALAGLVSGALLVGLSIADQRRTEPVPLHLRREHRRGRGPTTTEVR